MWSKGLHALALSLGLFGAACGGSASPVGGAPAAASPTTGAAAPSAAPASTNAAASAAPSASAAGAPTEVKIGLSTPVPEDLPLWMAKDKGFDRNNGLNFTLTTFEGGSKGLEALLGGSIDAMDVGLASVVIANSNGATFRSISSSGLASPFIITGAKGITADNAKEKLKGGKVGISSFGSESDVAVSLYLDKIGLARDKDVTVVQVGGTATRLTALLSGAINAGPLLGPDFIAAQSQGLTKLYDLSGQPNWVYDTLVVTKSSSDTRRGMLLAFLRTVEEGNYYARSHADEAKKVLASQFKQTDSKLTDASYDEFMKVAPLDLDFTTAAIQSVLQTVPAVTKDVKLKSTNPSDYVDSSLIDQLKSNGDLDRLKRQYGLH
ncbi:MAG TPA: ABC transporter substrate-binding protein [Chloroflexota bacterium]|nr:ABC transporter substrate-binding protein [Chloroflexota bacterium]